MSAGKQFLGPVGSMLTIGTAAPTPGDIGIELSTLHEGGMRPSKWLVTAVVTSAPSDLFVYGVVMHTGAIDTPADDQWGLHNNRYGTQASGKIGTALVVGTHHIVLVDVGIYTRLFFTRSAGAVDIYLRAILETNRGN